ncbi:hypothetical protein K456DRAFT_786856 [Colletotrichum gloeosporioides 23]|nr:hypothetical protein K456DRAFT_786856 [Colletotrichum gloeosporioides 23]
MVRGVGQSIFDSLCLFQSQASKGLGPVHLSPPRPRHPSPLERRAPFPWRMDGGGAQRRRGAPVSCVRRGRRAHHNISRPLSIAIPPVVCCRYATAMRGQGCRERVTAGRMRERWIDKRAWESWEATEDLGRGPPLEHASGPTLFRREMPWPALSARERKHGKPRPTRALGA